MLGNGCRIHGGVVAAGAKGIPYILWKRSILKRHREANETFRHFGARYTRQNPSKRTPFSANNASFYWTMYFEFVQALYEVKKVIKMGGPKKPASYRYWSWSNTGAYRRTKRYTGLEAMLQSEMNQKNRAADMEIVESCEELLLADWHARSAGVWG